MAKINTKTLTQEQIEKAMACKTADELLALAKAEGIDLTKDEAEAYMAETADAELTGAELERAAGGSWCEAFCPQRVWCPLVCKDFSPGIT